MYLCVCMITYVYMTYITIYNYILNKYAGLKYVEAKLRVFMS